MFGRFCSVRGLAWIFFGLAALRAAGTHGSTMATYVPSGMPASVAVPASEDRQNLLRTFSDLPLSFEANEGQADPAVRFLSRGLGYTMYFTPEAAIISLSGTVNDPGKSAAAAGHGTAIRMRWVGANAAAQTEGEDVLAGTSNYFVGKQVLTDIAQYARIRMKAVYPGIDLVYYGNRRNLEFDFILAPGADPAQIRLAFDGAEQVTLTAMGDLVLRTSLGEVIQRRPQLYQESRGEREFVEGHYVRGKNQQYGIHVAAYDKTRPLIIDPVLVYGNHVGGTGVAKGIAVDNAGNAYVTGYVWQQTGFTFPLVNAYDTTIGHADEDAFVQKYNPSGTALIYSTYLGGSRGNDAGIAIAIDGGGNAYVTGTTTGNDFPATASPYQAPVSTGGAFIAKLGPAGNSLLYSTYLLNVKPTAIAVDGGGNAYLTGSATSAFTTTPGAFQATTRSPASTNGFVFKLNPAGTAPVFSTFLGGSGTDQVNGMALDAAGNVYLAGITTSTDFPVANALRFNSAGGKEAFVTKLNAAGNGLVYSTYLGGAQDDYANAVAVDAFGSAYITGTTSSFDFPTRNAFQPTKAGARTPSVIDNAFITKLTPAGNDLVYSSFLGGESCLDANGIAQCLFYTRPVDYGSSIAVDAQGHAIFGGSTSSILFPRVDSDQGPVAGNGVAGFVAKVSVSGGALLYSALFGGEGDGSSVLGIGLDGAGNAYGVTNYSAFPTTATMPATTGTIVFKLANATTSLALASSVNPAVSGQTVTLSVAVGGGSSAGLVTFLNGSSTIGSAFPQNGTATLTANLPVGVRRLTAIYRDGSSEAESNLLYQVVNPLNVCP